MKKLFMLLALLTVMIFASSCSGDGVEVPDGMQVIENSTTGGYIFFAPSGWTAVNSDGVSAARTVGASMTFTEAAVPHATKAEYFNTDLENLPSEIKDTISVSVRDEECIFGNADEKCYKYIYSYEYKGEKHTTMQILVSHDFRFFIFTYTARGDASDENSEYMYYLNMVGQTIDNFRFTSPSGTLPTISYGVDPDGFNLVSDRSVSGFDLYVPKEYTPVYSGAYVKVRLGGAANISLIKATETGIGILDYLRVRKSELERFATDITDIKIGVAKAIDTTSSAFEAWELDVLPEYDEDLVFGNLSPEAIVSYEYKYTYNGSVYHVYQLMGVDSFNGYVFTYTAFEEEYPLHLDEIKTILEKVKF